MIVEDELSVIHTILLKTLQVNKRKLLISAILFLILFRLWHVSHSYFYLSLIKFLITFRHINQVGIFLINLNINCMVICYPLYYVQFHQWFHLNSKQQISTYPLKNPDLIDLCNLKLTPQRPDLNHSYFLFFIIIHNHCYFLKTNFILLLYNYFSYGYYNYYYYNYYYYYYYYHNHCFLSFNCRIIFYFIEVHCFKFYFIIKKIHFSL